MREWRQESTCCAPQVQLANERQALVQSRNLAKGSLLVLARNIGMSPGTDLELADPLAFHPIQSIEVEAVLPQALAARPDYQSLRRQRDALNEQLRASRARFLPKLTASGNYGGIGRTLGSINATGAGATIALALRFLIVTAMAKSARSRRASGASSGR